MAKRLTATDKWDKAWFRKLSTKHKCLWQYLVDKCDQAGVWEVDFDSASHFINDKITDEDLSVFGPRIEKFRDNKFWIVDFVDFQCGELSEKCPAHKPVFKLLKKYNLLNRVLNRLYNSQQEIEIEIEEEKEGEKEKPPVEPVDFSDEHFDRIFDSLTMEGYSIHYPKINILDQFAKFKMKVRGAPGQYATRDTGGMRSAFQYHLDKAKPEKNDHKGSNGVRNPSATHFGTL